MGLIPQGMIFTTLPTALRGKLQPNQLAVLWVVQSYEFGCRGCWPSLSTIAADAGLSVRKARETLGQLESLGFLRRQKRANPNGGQASNLYRVTFAQLVKEQKPVFMPPAPRAAPPAEYAGPPGTDRQGPPAGYAAKEDPIEEDPIEQGLVSKETKVAPKPKKRTRPEYSQTFLGFWSRYLKIQKRASSQSKPRAWDEFRKLPRGTQEALEGALRVAIGAQARAETNGGFAAPFPDCFRWIRDGRFEQHLETATMHALRTPCARDTQAHDSDPF
jgi:hypothetical protein